KPYALYLCGAPRDLHSFPTRRSSDLTLWLTTGLDHFVAFDVHSGRLTCEAGVLLRDIQQLAVPRGWMLPVTPGTQMITVGGAIRSEEHTSELQSREKLVCRLLLEKKK